jgi:hypothetical protein
MTINELIEKLILLRDDHGSDVKVHKCKRSVCDGSIQYIPIKDIAITTVDGNVKIVYV